MFLAFKELTPGVRKWLCPYILLVPFVVGETWSQVASGRSALVGGSAPRRAPPLRNQQPTKMTVLESRPFRRHSEPVPLSRLPPSSKPQHIDSTFHEAPQYITPLIPSILHGRWSGRLPLRSQLVVRYDGPWMWASPTHYRDGALARWRRSFASLGGSSRGNEKSARYVCRCWWRWVVTPL